MDLSYFGILILGFFISRVNILNNLTPFGIAFLSSYLMLKKADKGLLFSVILGIFTVQGFGGGYYYIASLLIYTFFDVINREKNYTLIIASFYGSLIFLGIRFLFLILLRRFITYNIFILIFESVLIFTMTYIFSFSLPMDKIKKRKFINEQLICIFINIALSLSGFINIILYCVSFKNIIIIFIVFYLIINYIIYI